MTSSEPLSDFCSGQKPEASKPWYVYLLQCEDDNTYIGATVDPERRLRQHNKELVGGARRTTAKSACGLLWQRILYVSGFRDNHHALQFEWRWKFLSRKLSGSAIAEATHRSGSAPLQRRLRALPETILKHPGTLQINAETACPGDLILSLQVQLAAAGLEIHIAPSSFGTIKDEA